MATNVPSVTNVMRLQSAVNHFTVENLLLTLILRVRKLVLMVLTRHVQIMSLVLLRHPAPIRILLTRMSWTWDRSTAEKIIQMLLHRVHLHVRVDQLPNAPSLVQSILVSPTLPATTPTPFSVALLGTMLHPTVSFHAKVD